MLFDTLRTNLRLVDVVMAQFIGIICTPFWVAFYILLAAALTFESLAHDPYQDAWSIFVSAVVSVLFNLSILGAFVLVLTVLSSLCSPKLRRGVLGEHVFTLTEEGLVEETAFNRSVHTWQSLDRVVQLFGYVLVRIAGNQWHVFPKRAFANGAEQQAFKTELQRRIRA